MREFPFADMNAKVRPSGYFARLSLFVEAPTTARIRLGDIIDQRYYDIGMWRQEKKNWAQIMNSKILIFFFFFQSFGRWE